MDLFLHDNKFSGEIPSSYGSCTSLGNFMVSKNSLSGKVPSGIWALSGLEIIGLSINMLKGSITTDISKAWSPQQLLLSQSFVWEATRGDLKGLESDGGCPELQRFLWDNPLDDRGNIWVGVPSAAEQQLLRLDTGIAELVQVFSQPQHSQQLSVGVRDVLNQTITQRLIFLPF
ncbi:hypothetical protein CDL15_Pgr007477 [Punica granatum]|uniref:Uncharacterized protein n=1 Tax=Punica granatum TaxID=22663 RepID=A0A218X9R0_PUNGR|nr:hypothetical protein CDL15_Pgr007477 [Punica granatum]